MAQFTVPRPTRVLPDWPPCCARALVEAVLERQGWPWNPSVSRWLDALVLAEEQAPPVTMTPPIPENLQ